jgi:uncharacterized protein (DUF58 family)
VVGLFCFAALLAGHQEMAVLSFLVGGLMGASWAWCRFAPNSMTCDFSVDRCRVYPHESLVLRTAVHNGKLLPVHFTLRLAGNRIVTPLEDQPDIRQSGWLRGFQRAQLKWDFCAKKRGVHVLGPPEITAGDLLGFYRRDLRVRSDIRIIVFPRLVRVKPVHFFRQDMYGKAGKSGLIPDPLYSAGTRDYQPGRPARHIHWKASAHHLRLQEKVYEPSFQEKLLFILYVDGFAAQRDENAFERTLEAAASLAVRLHAEGRPVGLVTNAASLYGPVAVPPGSGSRQLTALMDALAGMTMYPAGSIAEAVDSMAPLPWGLSCVLFSRDHDQQAAAILGSLSTRRVPAALVLCGTCGSAGTPASALPAPACGTPAPPEPGLPASRACTGGNEPMVLALSDLLEQDGGQA